MLSKFLPLRTKKKKRKEKEKKKERKKDRRRRKKKGNVCFISEFKYSRY